MYNICDFGAVSDKNINSTKAVQEAVDKCGKNGGGVVYVPFGVYTIASIHLYDNTHFVFEPGAKFLGSENIDDYDEREKIPYPLYQDCSHSYFHRSIDYKRKYYKELFFDELDENINAPAVNAEIEEEMKSILMCLSESDREVFYRHYILGEKVEDVTLAACITISAALGITAYAAGWMDNVIKIISTGHNEFAQVDTSDMEAKVPKEL